ncbi:hypothetical protein N0V90_004834 [Kalmusia sp. IMI 367209]|nr:hypothetical protein N0V90_004834 [Kalmusia sp. IMI 367209]
MASATACPVIGSTNDVLPSKPPRSRPQQGWPVPIADPKSPIATECPALKTAVQQPKSQAMDDAICPVVGTATTILPPDHPDTSKAGKDDVCPVTKATVEHHKEKVHTHPSLQAASEVSVCPVTGQHGLAHA